MPKSNDHRFIKWDRDTNAVRKDARFDEVGPLLELMRNHTDELHDEWL